MADEIDLATEAIEKTINAQIAARRALTEIQRNAQADADPFTHCLNCEEEITDPEFKAISKFCSSDCAQDYEDRYRTIKKQNTSIGQFINQ